MTQQELFHKNIVKYVENWSNWEYNPDSMNEQPVVRGVSNDHIYNFMFSQNSKVQYVSIIVYDEVLNLVHDTSLWGKRVIFKLDNS